MQLCLKDVAGSSSGESGVDFVTRSLHVKAINEANRTVDFVASTDIIDAHDEVIEQSSWILDDYLTNPVVLFAHQSHDLPIGRCVDVAVRGGPRGPQLECRVEFASAELNPKAEQVFRMVVEKFLRAVSVGFIPRTYRWEMRGGQEVWVWADCVLKEISVTPVPANPEALAKMKAKAARPAEARNGLPPYEGATNKTHNPALPGATPDNPTGTEMAPNDKDNIMADADKSLQEKLDKQATTIAELRLEAKTATERADKAEATASELGAKVKALETEKAALDAQTKTLAADRDAQKKRADELEAKSIEQEVDALVGKKITPAEKPLFVDLRKQNADLFAKMIEQRQPLALTEPVIATKKEENGVARPLDGDTSPVFAEIQKLSGNAGGTVGLVTG